MKTRIKELRQEKNYTQELLAVEIGANQTTLSRIECGLTIPDADIIIRLSSAFHVTTDYILCQSDQRLLPEPPAPIFQPAKDQPQNPLLEKLNPRQQSYLLRFLESMVGYY